MKFSLYALASLVMMTINSCNATHGYDDEYFLYDDYYCDYDVDIICGRHDLSTLCNALRTAGLGLPYSLKRTFFAPTNAAFEELGGEMLSKILGDNDLLTDIIKFHSVTAVISSDDLICTMRTEMANGQDSRTVCVGDDMFQKGGNNPRNDMPKIIETDIDHCEGYMHVVDEVMLPGRLLAPPAKDDCETIAEIVCGNDDFSTLCDVLNQAGLIDEFSTFDIRPWTVFAPTNTAFAELDSNVLDSVLADDDLLSNLLLFHAVEKVIYDEDFECTHLTQMANGEDSRHVCLGNGDIHQKGAGNPRSDMPRIIETDIGACNGVIHVVNEVMLPPL